MGQMNQNILYICSNNQNVFVSSILDFSFSKLLYPLSVVPECIPETCYSIFSIAGNDPCEWMIHLCEEILHGLPHHYRRSQNSRSFKVVLMLKYIFQQIFNDIFKDDINQYNNIINDSIHTTC